MKKAIVTDKAPKAIGPYSQAVEAGGFLFVSGQIPIDPATGELTPGGAAEQAERCLTNLEAVLRAAKLDMKNVVKITVFLTDMTSFGEMNAIYSRFFVEPFPARSTVQVGALPRGAKVEIEAIAAR